MLPNLCSQMFWQAYAASSLWTVSENSCISDLFLLTPAVSNNRIYIIPTEVDRASQKRGKGRLTAECLLTNVLSPFAVRRQIYVYLRSLPDSVPARISAGLTVFIGVFSTRAVLLLVRDSRKQLQESIIVRLLARRYLDSLTS